MLTRAEIPGLVFTAMLIALGAILIRWQWRSWKRAAVNSPDTLHLLWPQHLRRMKVAVLIVLEGCLLSIGDTLLPVLQRLGRITPRQMAILWTIDVMVILGVAIWLVLLALGDMFTTIAQNRRELLHSRQQERFLCDEIERFHEMGDDPPT